MKFIWNTLFVSLLVSFCFSCNKWENQCDDENPPNALPFGELFESYLMPSSDSIIIVYQDSISKVTYSLKSLKLGFINVVNGIHQFPDKKGDGQCYRYSQKSYTSPSSIIEYANYFTSKKERDFSIEISINGSKAQFGYAEFPLSNDTTFYSNTSIRSISEMEVSGDTINNLIEFSSQDDKLIFAKNRFIVKMKIKGKVYEVL